MAPVKEINVNKMISLVEAATRRLKQSTDVIQKTAMSSTSSLSVSYPATYESDIEMAFKVDESAKSK